MQHLTIDFRMYTTETYDTVDEFGKNCVQILSHADKVNSITLRFGMENHYLIATHIENLLALIAEHKIPSVEVIISGLRNNHKCVDSLQKIASNITLLSLEYTDLTVVDTLLSHTVKLTDLTVTPDIYYTPEPADCTKFWQQVSQMNTLNALSVGGISMPLDCAGFVFSSLTEITVSCPINDEQDWQTFHNVVFGQMPLLKSIELDFITWNSDNLTRFRKYCPKATSIKCGNTLEELILHYPQPLQLFEVIGPVCPKIKYLEVDTLVDTDIHHITENWGKQIVSLSLGYHCNWTAPSLAVFPKLDALSMNLEIFRLLCANNYEVFSLMKRNGVIGSGRVYITLSWEEVGKKEYECDNDRMLIFSVFRNTRILAPLLDRNPECILWDDEQQVYLDLGLFQ